MKICAIENTIEKTISGIYARIMPLAIKIREGTIDKIKDLDITSILVKKAQVIK